MKRPSATPALSAAILLLALSFAACGKSSTPSVAINLTNAPATLTVNQSVSLTASVGYDSSNAGVDWSCSGSASCGSFSPAHTASGGTTVYTAPASAGNVTITAAATADSSAKASVTISIVPIGSNAMLNGAYVFSVQGTDRNGMYAAGGTIVADGNGNITAGEQDYTDVSVQAGPDSLTGTYSIGPDGRGSLTLSVSDASLPHNGVETFSVAVTSAAHALITQFDGTASSSGSLDLQTAGALDPAAVAGAYAFTVQGEDVTYQAPACFGGVLVMSAASGTVSDGTYFVNDGGSTNSGTLSGVVTVPDGFGRGTIDFAMGLNLAYYAVRGQVLRLVGLNAPYTVVGGSMYSQGAAGAGGTFTTASLSGSYVLSEAGGSVAGALALAGQFASDGAGNFTSGFADTNDAGTSSSASIAGTPAYSMAGNGVGTLSLPAAVDTTGNVGALVIFAVDPAVNLLDPSLPGGGGGALVMDYDSTAVASGSIVPQATGPFDGNYALNLQLVASDGENDWVGQTVAASGGLAGTVDINDAGATSSNESLTGTFAADGSYAGRWTGHFTVAGTSHAIVYYQVSPTLFVIVDKNSADVGFGIMETE
ncbi:MAG TPA: hypothetical protein VMS75_03895 [Terriglobales bacterium]|nr:hypothetical protein [Terriglobales bacterium]